jgi:DNA-binding transcriptional LysR family regulator
LEIMNFEQLETLICLARLRSFRATAKRLNTSQPGVTLRIQRLEEELGAQLFERTQRTVSLTALGRECLAYAEQIVVWRDEIQDRVARLGAIRGRVNLGVSELIAHTWLSDLLASLAARYPRVHINPTIDLTPKLLHDFDGGEFDVVLIGARALTTTHPVLDIGSVAYRWMEKPPAVPSMKPLTPRDLQSRQIITWPKDAALHRSIRDWFLDHGAYAFEPITCNSALTMATMAAAGLGISLLPVEVVQRELAEGRLAIIPVEPEFEPVQYKAVYAQRRGSLGEIVAQTAKQISTFAP